MIKAEEAAQLTDNAYMRMAEEVITRQANKGYNFANIHAPLNLPVQQAVFEKYGYEVEITKSIEGTIRISWGNNNGKA